MTSLLALLAGILGTIVAKRDARVPSVLAIIPTAVTDETMLQKCIDTLHAASKGVTLRVILVLCPTTPEKARIMQRTAANKAECVMLDGPFSFARSNNEGLKRMNGEEYILFINDDCFFRGPYDVKRLVRSLDKRGLAAVGPWMNHQAFCSELPKEWRTMGMKRTRFPIIGACMLWSRAWLDRIGTFDESFDGYGMEEADLFFRVLGQGGRWMRDDRITVDHVHHATFGGSVKDTEPHHRNLKRWAEKYPGIDSWGKTSEWTANLKF